jgi:hypothetical protein
LSHALQDLPMRAVAFFTTRALDVLMVALVFTVLS